MRQTRTRVVSRTHRETPVRVWLLSLLAALTGFAAAGLSVILDGTPRAVFASAAVVLLVTALFCVVVTFFESHSAPPFDPDEPLEEPPVPHSQVTLVHDPKETHK